MIKAEQLYKQPVKPSEMDSVKTRKKELRIKGNDVALLHRCETVWNNFDDFRQARARSLRFCYGDQWADTIVVNGEAKTYRKYLLETGNVVLQTNQIKNKVETIVGQMTRDQMEPVCHAIDRDEQTFGEVVTAGVQANCDKNGITELKKLWMRELNLGGMCIAYEVYDDCSGPDRTADSWTMYINPNLYFHESESVDPRSWDFSLVGRFFYGSFETICARFAKSPSDYDILRQIYSNQSSVFREEESRQIDDRFDEGELVFMHSSDPTRCYVCEVWTKETKPRIRLWDKNYGREEIIDADDHIYRREIKTENERRRRMGFESGWTEEEIAGSLIVGDGYGQDEDERNGFFMDTFWYCRFLAPDGTILWEGESPYADRSHPFTVCMFPFVDGKLVGYMNDAIDHNLAMNRAVVMHDWLLRAQQKGMAVVPKSILGNLTEKEFVRSWTSIDDVVFLDIDESKKDLFPQVFHGPAQTFDLGNLLATYKKLMDEGTPVNAALQGKTPGAGTSGALYAQMSVNASTPIAALMDSFNKFVEKLETKKMKNLVMFYTPERWEKIAGETDGLIDPENLNLNEIGNLEYDLKVKESTNAMVPRAMVNQDAKEFLLNGLISFEEYLEIADVPYADKILQGRQARQAEMESGAAPSSPEAIPTESDELAQPNPLAGGVAPNVRLPKAPLPDGGAELM